ncbi:DUF99 family protein [Halobacteria archaeon AArc-dxtr1]|nr:DUF99 family protein [Halobacteria archaeon AArc-dxtr1]
MKSGVRAVGVAESAGDDRQTATLAGAVVRADGIVDGLSYADCTVGGTDATAAVGSLLADLDRPDARYVLLGAVAPAWYNVLDLERLAEASDGPVIAVTFEESDGLAPALRAEFSGVELERRLTRYRALPPREPVAVGSETMYVRAVGCERQEAERVVQAFTDSGGRPEPIRVARLAARAARRYREKSSQP